MVEQLSVEDLSNLIQSDQQDYFLLDVRENWEYDICKIEGSHLISLQNLLDEIDEIPDDKLIICICHHGVRSLNAAHLLYSLGKKTVANLQGGIDLWAKKIDKGLKTY